MTKTQKRIYEISVKSKSHSISSLHLNIAFLIIDDIDVTEIGSIFVIPKQDVISFMYGVFSNDERTLYNEFNNENQTSTVQFISLKYPFIPVIIWP